MGEVIRLEEIDHQRRRSRARRAERAHLERAVALLRENLASAAQALRDAPSASAPQTQMQIELLGRIERLTAMIRYGLRMVGDTSGDGLDDPTLSNHPAARR
jgi:hypothetical protein